MAHGQGMFTTNFEGFFGRNPRLYARMGEGYKTGEYYLDHLTRENLQEIADWMISLPAYLYAPIEHIHQHLEYFLLNEPL